MGALFFNYGEVDLGNADDMLGNTEHNIATGLNDGFTDNAFQSVTVGEDSQIVAIEYDITAVNVSVDGSPGISPDGAGNIMNTEFQVSVRDTFALDPSTPGIYDHTNLALLAANAFEDETNGTGGQGNAVPMRYATLLDPSRDTVDVARVLHAGNSINLHLFIPTTGEVVDNGAISTSTELKVWVREV